MDLRAQVEASIAAKQQFLSQCLPQVEQLVDLALACLGRGGKLMFCGNGGSACDAAHAVGELVGWFEDKQRGGIPAIALGHEIPTMTAIGNDQGFDRIFSRQVETLGRPEDLVIGISTSGSSRNVLAAVEAAVALGASSAALVSQRGGPIADAVQVAVTVPSDSTPRIQECHLLAVHLLCAAIEARL